ncbi:Pyruvate carboxylase 1 [Lecanosticta acicola]|uniref:Pyruvate carboxylase 1 n=1 Tax=Lecanosticta acicola TaxID=111012 RepID=A0AAI8Z638_9PEZI|nr:Pyruvate carboxylase 1 [Lecanosticta acicola]
MPLRNHPPPPRRRRRIHKILIANRGEIATRILTTCRELHLETYALYTDHDVSHTCHAQHALRLESPAGYTEIETLVSIVREYGIDAVHPGYGFLSESAVFAERLEAVGVLVVGPGSAVLRRTGDKVAARQLAEGCGVAVLPGFFHDEEEEGGGEGTGEVMMMRRMREFVSRVGFPVMIKAVDGGGGRGIRLVRRAEELEGAVRRAVEESASRRVFVEKAAVEGYRHVEVQILGDGRGGVRHLWERECSIQRRYQKVVEVAPSRCADREVVRPVIEAAVRIAQGLAYLSLGTFEFLVNPTTEEWFFLEINPRLQVEHTITEAICAEDLVKAQLRLAQGASLEEIGLGSLEQDALLVPRQHAIQLRVTAEEPAKQYALSIGKLHSFRFPSGVGTRVDTALVAGAPAPAIVTSDFDSVLAKIIITARTWPDAVSKARRALEDTAVAGIPTNLPLLRAVVAHPDFEAGNCDTQWLESKHDELLARSRQYPDVKDPFHALVPSSTPSAALAAVGGTSSSAGPALFKKNDAWKLVLKPLPTSSTGGREEEKAGEAQTHHLSLQTLHQNDFPTALTALIHYTTPASKSPQPYHLTLTSTLASASALSTPHPQGDPSNPAHITLPLSGKLVEVLVDAGDVVKAEDVICVIKQMKMEVEVRSHRAGVVIWATEAADGEDVAEGMLLAVVEEEEKKVVASSSSSSSKL